MLSPQGYQIGKDPRAKNPFWDEGESADVRRIFATASVDNNVGTPQVQTSKTISGNDIIFGFDFKNLKGRPGNDGAPGEPGSPGSDGVDGFSPIANVEQTADGATITVTDKNGTTSAVVRNGRDGTNGTNGTDGANGADGFSPIVNITQTPTGAVVSVTDATGTTEATISNGERGSDGVSPTASVEQTADGATVTVTDAQGTTTANLRNGRDGTDGVSPTASVTQTQTGATVTVTDAQGTTTAELTNGQDGTDGVSPTASVEQTGTNEVTFSVTDAQGTTTARLTGQAGTPGVSPTVTITDITGGHRVTVTDANGSRYFDVMDGTPGQNGSDGFSPTVAIADITGGHRITVTDANGSQSFDVMDGTQGQQGTPGVGVPAGGTAGQVLAKVDGTDYNTEWVTPQSGGGGNIVRKRVVINKVISTVYNQATIGTQIPNGGIAIDSTNFGSSIVAAESDMTYSELRNLVINNLDKIVAAKMWHQYTAYVKTSRNLVVSNVADSMDAYPYLYAYPSYSTTTSSAISLGRDGYTHFDFWVEETT